MIRYAFLYLLFFIFIDTSKAQIENPVKWQFDYQYLDYKTIKLKFTASIENKWHMYGAFFPEGGPIPTSFHYDTSKSFKILGPVIELTPPIKKKDPNFDNMEISLHNGKAVFAQKVILNKPEAIIINGYVEFMVCNDQKCLPPKDIDFSIKILPRKNLKHSVKIEKTSSFKSETLAETKNTKTTDSAIVKNSSNDLSKVSNKSRDNYSLWKLFIKAILAGLGGVFTPCVYPMIPLTVMFFLKGSENRSKAILKGLLFGISIIIIYLLLGLLLGKFIQLIAQHWLSNLFFFLLFLTFTLSFLGLFEIVLPGSLATKVDKQADKGGYFGVFFMALALVIVSTSCTVPLIGYVLVEGSSDLKQSVIGMFGYSLAFALPFSFFAMFPSLLQSLPRSGAWMNAFKVMIGLIILLFSFKYLIIVDQSLHLNLLSREIVLSIWIATSALAGLYLLGKIKFKHDSEITHISVPRFLLALCAFSFAIYLLGNMIFKGNLDNLASFIPPRSEISNNVAGVNSNNSNNLCNTPKYSDFLQLPYNLQGYFDYKEGLACAKKQDKPLLIDFKGYSCANCKVMEAKVWSNPEVQKLLNDNFFIIALYADERTKLPENEWVKSKIDGKLKKTLGQLNQDIEIEMFQTNALPLYAIVNSNGQPLVKPIGTELNIQKYLAFLKEGIENYRKKSE